MDLWPNGFGLFLRSRSVPGLFEMDGRAVFDFAYRDVARSIKETIENGSIAASELIILLHQANIRIFG